MDHLGATWSERRRYWSLAEVRQDWPLLLPHEKKDLKSLLQMELSHPSTKHVAKA